MNRLGHFSSYPLGQGWLTSAGVWSAPRFWLGATVDLCLALSPAVALLLLTAGPTDPSVERRQDSDLVIASIAFCGFLLAIDTWARSTLGQPAAWQDGATLAAVVLPTCVFGALLGLKRIRWLPVLVLVPVLAYGWEDVLDTGNGLRGMWPTPSEAAQAIPLLMLTLLAAAWEPLTRFFGRLRESNVGMLVTVNVLNIADAALTAFALHHERAVETNPVVTVLTLPGKVLLVGLLSLALFRYRPKALIWPAIALLAVIAWHFAGVVVSSRLL